MPATDRRPVSSRLIFSIRRLVHSIAYFLASIAALALFVLVLMLAESLLYALTGEPVSVWSMVVAAVAVAFGFGPVLHALQGWLDRLFFRRHLDTLAAIRQLGAGDLAKLPVRDVEPALLERICRVSHRRFAALDERARAEGRLAVWPEDAPAPEDSAAYEMKLARPRGGGEPAWLWLGPRHDGWPTDEDERESLKSLARFAAMSLEHARLTHQVAESARLDSLSRVVRQLHSHDLKNRLHDLRFLAHHLASGKLEAADMARLVEAIGKVTGRMQTLMQRL
ncbi:MAG: ATP-binding protein, partial [Mariprofundaceae bacterium]